MGNEKHLKLLQGIANGLKINDENIKLMEYLYKTHGCCYDFSRLDNWKGTLFYEYLKKISPSPFLKFKGCAGCPLDNLFGSLCYESEGDKGIIANHYLMSKLC